MFLSEYAPIKFILNQDNPCVLSIIINSTGPSYREVGSMMAFSSEGERCGSLSSGCIEDDLWLSAKSSFEKESPVISNYGLGSNIFDLKLPCGGGIKILSVPNPDKSMLNQIINGLDNRLPRGVSINLLTGSIEVTDLIHKKLKDKIFCFNLIPETKFIVMGAGAETYTFCSLSLAAGFEVKLLSPDISLINDVAFDQCDVFHLSSFDDFPDVQIDKWTAIVLFFHDHEWEPHLLRKILKSNAFYIGAQGSKVAHLNLLTQLKEMGATKSELARLQDKIGLIPSARDPKTLAISVLADVVDKSISANI